MGLMFPENKFFVLMYSNSCSYLTFVEVVLGNITI